MPRCGSSGSGGDSATEQDFYCGLRGRSVSSSNSQKSSPHRSLSGQSFSIVYPLGGEVLDYIHSGRLMCRGAILGAFILCLRDSCGDFILPKRVLIFTLPDLTRAKKCYQKAIPQEIHFFIFNLEFLNYQVNAIIIMICNSFYQSTDS